MDGVSKKTRWAKQIAAGLSAISAVVVLYFFAPTDYAFYPRCFFHSLTGLNCPGCGVLRATHQLLHGNFASAFALNPLFILLLPVAGIFLTRRAIRAASGKPAKFVVQKIWIGLGLVALIAFTVFRNFPFAA